MKETETSKIFNGDAGEVLKTFPVASVDMIVTDPPAGINLLGNSWDNPVNYSTFKNTHSKQKAFIEWLTQIFTQCKRVAKKNTKLITWTLPKTWHWTAKALIDSGWYINEEFYHVFSTGLAKSQAIDKKLEKVTDDREIIDKWKGWGTSLKPGYEKWLVASLKPSVDLKVNVFYGKKANNRERCMPNDETNTHPSLKTVDLMKQILSLYSEPNDSILDPFMGSGTTGVAARELDLSFIGVEQDSDNFKIANTRLFSKKYLDIEF